MAYSLDPNSFESVQLFVKHRADNTVKTADVEALGSLLYPAIAAFKSGQWPELQLSPYLSKILAAYFSALAVVAPCYKTTDTRNKLDQRFNKELRELNKIDDEKIQMYIVRKLKGGGQQVSSCRALPGQGRRWGRRGEGEEGDGGGDLDDGYAIVSPASTPGDEWILMSMKLSTWGSREEGSLAGNVPA